MSKEVRPFYLAVQGSKQFSATLRPTTTGLLETINTDEFIVLNHFRNTILLRLDIANKLLQSSHESFTSALESINNLREDIKVLKAEYDEIKIGEVITEAIDRVHPQRDRRDGMTCSRDN